VIKHLVLIYSRKTQHWQTHKN